MSPDTRLGLVAPPPRDEEPARSYAYDTSVHYVGLTRRQQEENEEYGEEYAAFGRGPGAQVAHLEDGVLYQSLQEEADGQQVPQAVSNLATLCRRELQSTGAARPHGACAQFVDLCHSPFGGCGRFVKQSRNSNFRPEFRRGGIWAGTIGHPPAGQVGDWRSERSYWRDTYRLAKEAMSLISCAREAIHTGACSYRD